MPYKWPHFIKYIFHFFTNILQKSLSVVKHSSSGSCLTSLKGSPSTSSLPLLEEPTAIAVAACSSRTSYCEDVEHEPLKDKEDPKIEVLGDGEVRIVIDGEEEKPLLDERK